MELQLTQPQAKRLEDFSQINEGVCGWSVDDRGLGRTTLLRAIALVEAQDKPVTVLVPNEVCAREFLRGMPQEILESYRVRYQNPMLEYGKGIRVLTCTSFHKLLGCQRECILVDDAMNIDPEIINYHASRARKMFICA